MEHMYVTSLVQLQLPSRLCNDSSRVFSRFLTGPVRKLRYATHLGAWADFGQGRDHPKAARSSNYTLSTQVCQVKELGETTATVGWDICTRRFVDGACFVDSGIRAIAHRCSPACMGITCVLAYNIVSTPAFIIY